MPTLKKRINITVTDEMEAMLEAMAKKADVPVATKANQLLEEIIEMHEDDIWTDLAEERLKRKEKTIPHEEAWS